MATKKAAKKRPPSKAKPPPMPGSRSRRGSTDRRVNDPLRELLEFVVAQIEGARQDTQELEGVQDLLEPLQLAIEDLEKDPGPQQGGGH